MLQGWNEEETALEKKKDHRAVEISMFIDVLACPSHVRSDFTCLSSELVFSETHAAEAEELWGKHAGWSKDTHSSVSLYYVCYLYGRT